MRPAKIFIPALILLILLATTTSANAQEDLGFRAQFDHEFAALESQYGHAKLSAHGGMVIASAIYCVVQKQGLSDTVAFYHDVKFVAEQTKSLCDAGHERDAKNYALSQFIPRQHDPMVTATLACYDRYAADLAALIPDPKKRADLPNYERWAHDPARAEREMTGQEICH